LERILGALACLQDALGDGFAGLYHRILMLLAVVSIGRLLFARSKEEGPSLSTIKRRDRRENISNTSLQQIRLA
jgi:hypothetical protein